MKKVQDLLLQNLARNSDPKKSERRKDKSSFVRRGEVYYANLDPVKGSEQGGERPVLVIQNNQGNKHSPTIIVAAITSHIAKEYLPTHVRIPESLSGYVSIVMLEQIRTLDKSRLGSKIGEVTTDIMISVNEALRISLGI